ncbi:MAG TPA: DegT/DnrJ/EryC1/StrS family aminotransferase [Elusimicrobiota bacterium]|nr:DegT/DnrJ/EryC1/StrS family aminotransferase [Elusimicrobiota bacterium]
MSAAATVYAPPSAPAWRLEDELPGRTVRYYSYGRRALAAALSALKLGPGKSVLFPEFVCRDLLSAAAAAGASCVFYPVGADLAPSEPPARWPRAAAALAVNYFGFPQDLAPFEEYRRLTGAAIVEDNAHGLFSRDGAGRPLGTRGDWGIFSLRKSLPLPNGAALVGPAELPAQEPFAPAADARAAARALVGSAARALGPRAALALLRSARALRAFKNGSRLPGPDPDSETRLPEPSRPCAELERPLEIAGPATELARRRRLFGEVAAILEGTGARALFSSLPEGVCPYAFPFRAAKDALAAAQRALGRAGLEPLPWPDLPSAVSGHAPEHYRDLWLAHFLW